MDEYISDASSNLCFSPFMFRIRLMTRLKKENISTDDIWIKILTEKKKVWKYEKIINSRSLSFLYRLTDDSRLFLWLSLKILCLIRSAPCRKYRTISKNISERTYSRLVKGQQIAHILSHIRSLIHIRSG